MHRIHPVRYSGNVGTELICCRYVLDIGQSEDWYALQISMLPCLLGYNRIARRLHGDKKTKSADNPFYSWIENYISGSFENQVRIGTSELISLYCFADHEHAAELAWNGC